MPEGPTFKGRQIVGGRKNIRWQRVPQIRCGWKEAGSISIDPLITDINAISMRGRS